VTFDRILHFAIDALAGVVAVVAVMELRKERRRRRELLAMRIRFRDASGRVLVCMTVAEVDTVAKAQAFDRRHGLPVLPHPVEPHALDVR